MLSSYTSYDNMFALRLVRLVKILRRQIFQDRLKSVLGFIPRLKYGGFHHFPVNKTWIKNPLGLGHGMAMSLQNLKPNLIQIKSAK